MLFRSISENCKQTLMDRFNACSSIRSAELKAAVALYSSIYEQFVVCQNRYRIKYKYEKCAALTYKIVFVVLQFMSKARLLISAIYGEYRLHEKTIRNRSLSLGYKSNLSASTDRDYESKSSIRDLIGKKTTSNFNTPIKTKENMSEFINKCMKKMHPMNFKEEPLKCSIYRANTDRILEIDKKEKNKKMLDMSLKLLKESNFDNQEEENERKNVKNRTADMCVNRERKDETVSERRKKFTENRTV